MTEVEQEQIDNLAMALIALTKVVFIHQKAVRTLFLWGITLLLVILGLLWYINGLAVRLETLELLLETKNVNSKL